MYTHKCANCGAKLQSVTYFAPCCGANETFQRPIPLAHNIKRLRDNVEVLKNETKLLERWLRYGHDLRAWDVYQEEAQSTETEE